jgi:hypothetical protein
MRRRRRRINRSNPLPPYRRFYRVESPFHMTMFVLCYGQRAQPQPLARVVQTGGDGCAGLMLGERRLAGWNGLPSASCGAAGGARSLLVTWEP